MPIITISERDETSFGTLAENFDVAYVPGLVDTTKTTNPIPYGVPHLFTSVNDFKSMCGSAPYQFKSNQEYSSLLSDGIGFDDKAIPFDGVMIHKDEYDPGYLTAIELLASGLNVVYERLNADEVLMKTLVAPTGEDVKYKGTITKKLAFNSRSEADEAAFISLFDADDTEVVFTSTEYTTVYTLNEQTGRMVSTDFESLCDIAKRSHDDLITFDEENSKVTIKAEADKFFKQWKPNAIFTSTNKVFSDIALTEMPTDWYTDYTKYGCQKTVVEEKNNENAELLTAPFYIVKDACSISNIYNELAKVYSTDDIDGLVDKGNFNIKYITSGGYPVYEYNRNSIVSAMLSLAETRGDAIALIDHADNSDRLLDPNNTTSLYSTVKVDTTFNGLEAQYGVMFTPWAEYSITTQGTTQRMPASFGYLLALADSIKTNAPWLAIAGSARGAVPHLSSAGIDRPIPNSLANAMQPRTGGVSVNAITNIKPYGNIIWGNRTLKNNGDNLVATSFLNIRNLISDVKKVCYRTARALTFEQDNDVLWVNFKSSIAPTLDRMVSGYGISGYKILRDNDRAEASAKATVCAKIVLYPVDAVEDFYIDIVLRDDDVTIE